MIEPIDLTAALLALAPLRESMGLLGEAERVLLEVDRGGFTSEDLRELDSLQPNDELRVNGVAVFVYINESPSEASAVQSRKVHFVYCRQLQQMETRERGYRYFLTRETSGRFLMKRDAGGQFRASLVVCAHCLLAVHWDGYDRDLSADEKDDIKHAFSYAEYLKSRRRQSVRHHRPPLSQTVVEQRLWRGSAYEAVQARLGRRG